MGIDDIVQRLLEFEAVPLGLDLKENTRVGSLVRREGRITDTNHNNTETGIKGAIIGMAVIHQTVRQNVEFTLEVLQTGESLLFETVFWGRGLFPFYERFGAAVSNAYDARESVTVIYRLPSPGKTARASMLATPTNLFVQAAGKNEILRAVNSDTFKEYARQSGYDKAILDSVFKRKP